MTTVTADNDIASGLFQFLVARGVLGLAWADTDLRVLGSVGSLAGWLVPGAMLSDDLTVFTGLEDDLHALVDDFYPSLVLANVGLPHSSGASTAPEGEPDGDLEARVKISIEVFFDAADAHFVIVVHRLGAQPDFEQDLARQRRRCSAARCSSATRRPRICRARSCSKSG
ncbi:MAG: hypothetical protein AAGJ70_02915, partial [Pseudomonadota bacterium]